MQGESFEVGPYHCTPHAESPTRGETHLGGVVIRRQVGDRTLEARVRFEEEGFGQPGDAVAYAAARADYLLRVQPRGLVSF